MDMSGWRLRLSRPDDLERLHAVWLAAVSASHDFLQPDDLQAISIQVRERYLPGAALLVAADTDDRPVGFMGLTGGEIDSLFVDPAWRGRGLGRALVEQALKTAEGEIGVSVNEQNHAAVCFYEALGFWAYARSATDDRGRPYPVLKMRRRPR